MVSVDPNEEVRGVCPACWGSGIVPPADWTGELWALANVHDELYSAGPGDVTAWTSLYGAKQCAKTLDKWHEPVRIA
jgi:hypothetical protein